LIRRDQHASFFGFRRASWGKFGATGTSDVIDASVVIVARERNDNIVTSDADDLRRLDPTAPIFTI
jgi:hypothetical protein